MTDLVVVSLEDWDEVWRRNQHIVAGLLAIDPQLRVMFVEPATDPLHDLISRRAPRFGHRVRRNQDVGHGRLWTWRGVKWLPRRWDRDADGRLARGIARTAGGLGMSDPVLWINDPSLSTLSATTGWPTVYDMTDDWLAADRPAAERVRLAAGERQLLETAEQVVACSAELVQRKAPARRAAPIVLIPNAVDVDACRRPKARPADLPSGPTIVYVGTVHPDRFDVDLCSKTATEMQREARIVLVGPQLLDHSDSQRLEDAGVLLLGGRPSEAVIGYLQHADVLIVPHVVDEFTDSLDPIKLYEYQAVGRPVVATPVAGFRDSLSRHLRLTERDDFTHTVRAALADSAPFPTGADEPVPDWADRVRSMAAVLHRAAAAHTQ